MAWAARNRFLIRSAVLTHADYFAPGTVIICGKGHKNRHSAAPIQSSFCFDGAKSRLMRTAQPSGQGGHVSPNDRLKIRPTFIWFAAFDRNIDVLGKVAQCGGGPGIVSDTLWLIAGRRDESKESNFWQSLEGLATGGRWNAPVMAGSEWGGARLQSHPTFSAARWVGAFRAPSITICIEMTSVQSPSARFWAGRPRLMQGRHRD
jgi:hypothetical protein